MDPNITANTLDADTVGAIGLDPTGRDGDPRFPFTEASLTDTERARLARYRNIGLGFTVIDLDRVVTLLRERHGIGDAYVEQTGGGCATIYAGRIAAHDPFRGAVWTVSAGPGWFDGPAWTKARASLDDFYIGAAGDDWVELGTVTRDDDENTVAATIAAAVTARRAALAALLARIRAVPGYHQAPFLADPDIAVELADDPAAPADELLAAAAIVAIRAETASPTALAFDTTGVAARIAAAVTQDIAEGIIPITATTFAALHAAVDANDYLIDAGVPTDPDTVAHVQHQAEYRLAILAYKVRRLIRQYAP